MYDFNGVLQVLLDKIGDKVPAVPDAAVEDVAPRRGQLEAQLLRAWAHLQPLVAMSEGSLLEEQIPQAQMRVHLAEVLYEHTQEDRQNALRDLRSPRQDVAEEAIQRFAASEHKTIDAARRLSMARKHLGNLEARVKQTASLLNLHLTSEELDALGEWRTSFREEVDLVKAAWQAVAHAEPIQDDKLEAADKLAEGLLVAWELRRTRIPTQAMTGVAADGQQSSLGEPDISAHGT